jgi:hypothetical protein
MLDAGLVARLWEQVPRHWPLAPPDWDSDRIAQVVQDVRAEGYTQALVLGTGGASLAPALFRHLFGAAPGALPLAVLDSPDPSTVEAYTQWCDPAHTLFVVASPTGTSLATRALYNHFYNHVAATPQEQAVGRHFVALTAPQSPLATLATHTGFRTLFPADPSLGEHAAAVSLVGGVPAALLGADLPRLLAPAAQMQHACATGAETNPGVQLGALLQALARAGRDKMTVRTSATLSALGPWLEHLLVAHPDTGLFPIIHEPLGLPTAYGPDRLFVYFQFQGDDEQQQHEVLAALAAAGHPVVHVRMHDVYEVGGQVVLWEVAAALAGARLGRTPLAPPAVDAATEHAQAIVEAYRATGTFPEDPPAAIFDDMRLEGTPGARSPEEALLAFLAQGQPGDAVTVQAYLPPPLDLPMIGPDTPERTRLRQETVEIRTTLMSMCGRIRDKYGVAATFGYGPGAWPVTDARPPGAPGRRLVLQCTADTLHDVPIPTDADARATTLSFGTLQAAQALGERQALMEAGQPIARVHLGTQGVERLRQLNQALV